MSRPAVVYLVMVVVLIAGLWAVLAIGRHLSAPEDLAGKWQLQSNIRGIPDDALLIEQSGRFFQVTFDHGPKLDLKLTTQSATAQCLSNSDSKLTVSGTPGSDEKTIELSGAAVGRWSAHRLVRSFPVDVSGREAH